VIANQGVMAGQPVAKEDLKPGFRTLNPVGILKVVDSNDKTLYEFKQAQTQRTFILYSLLPSSLDKCRRFAAAKTGMTSGARTGRLVTPDGRRYGLSGQRGMEHQRCSRATDLARCDGKFIGNPQHSLIIRLNGSRGGGATMVFVTHLS
jgi:hypothetical protein